MRSCPNRAIVFVQQEGFDKRREEVQNTALRFRAHNRGDVAQLGEHHVRNVGVVGSNPIISTMVVEQAWQRAKPVLRYAPLLQLDGAENSAVCIAKSNNSPL